MPPTPEEVGGLRESFTYNDPNGDGKIDFGEFRNMLKDYRRPGPSRAEALSRSWPRARCALLHMGSCAIAMRGMLALP